MEKESNDNSGSSLNAFDLLGGTMQGAGSAVSSITLALQNTMERSVQMAKTMNHVMQQVLRTNVKVSTKFESLPDGSMLIITIHNATAFPIIGMTGTIDFKPSTTTLALDREYVESIPEVPELTFVSSSHHMPNGQPSQPVESLFFPTTTTTPKNNTATVFSPNTKHVEVLCINTPCLTRYNGLIDIQIPLPGDDSSASIHLTNPFGVYLIDQMKKLFNTDTNVQDSQEDEEDGSSLEREYHGQFIRDVFVLNPVLGLEQGMHFYLDPPSGENGLITCRVESTCLETGKIQVCFYGKNKNLVSLVVDELDSLDK